MDYFSRWLWNRFIKFLPSQQNEQTEPFLWFWWRLHQMYGIRWRELASLHHWHLLSRNTIFVSFNSDPSLYFSVEVNIILKSNIILSLWIYQNLCDCLLTAELSDHFSFLCRFNNVVVRIYVLCHLTTFADFFRIYFQKHIKASGHFKGSW